MSANSLTKIILLKRPDIFRKSFQLHRPLELLASKERSESDGSGGAIITLWLIREYALYERRPFVMISRCNGFRTNNSLSSSSVTLGRMFCKKCTSETLALVWGSYFCLDTKVAKDQAEVFKTGLLILRWIILKVFVRSDAVLDFSPERIIPASQTHPDHALFSVLNTKGEYF